MRFKHATILHLLTRASPTFRPLIVKRSLPEKGWHCQYFVSPTHKERSNLITKFKQQFDLGWTLTKFTGKLSFPSWCRVDFSAGEIERWKFMTIEIHPTHHFSVTSTRYTVHVTERMSLYPCATNWYWREVATFVDLTCPCLTSFNFTR